MRVKHYSIRTETQYSQWIRRFILFHGKKHPRNMGSPEVEAFLTHLAVEGNVAAATRNQALSALLFLYKEVQGIDLPWLHKVTCAERPQCLPMGMTRDEVHAVLNRIVWVYGLKARFFYGTGIRPQGCGDDDDVHARFEQGRARGDEPAGPLLNEPLPLTGF